jgi:hypothetical protein
LFDLEGIKVTLDWFRGARYLGINESRVAKAIQVPERGQTRGDGVDKCSWEHRGRQGEGQDYDPVSQRDLVLVPARFGINH